MGQSSQHQEPPLNPGRFRARRAEPLVDLVGEVLGTNTGVRGVAGIRHHVLDELDDQIDAGVEARYWNLEQVAAYLTVSVPQVYALVRSGELPAIKIGGRGVWRVDRHKLEDYLERVEAQTAEWAKAHPLTRKDEKE